MLPSQPSLTEDHTTDGTGLAVPTWRLPQDRGTLNRSEDQGGELTGLTVKQS